MGQAMGSYTTMEQCEGCGRQAAMRCKRCRRGLCKACYKLQCPVLPCALSHCEACVTETSRLEVFNRTLLPVYV